MNIDSIIFDLDGTLWSSTDVVRKAWNEVLRGYEEIKSEITNEDLEGIMGLQIKDIGKKLFPYLGEVMQGKILKECCELENEYLAEQGGILYGNLEEVLIELSRSYKLFIVSNCQCGYIEAFLKYHKLGKYFTDFENPGRTGLTKGENIRLIMERNHLSNPVYVGDTEGDFKAAKFAQIPFIYARYGFGEVEGYDYVIDSLNELMEIVKRV
jgi:phosphoglycolate phosphatase